MGKKLVVWFKDVDKDDVGLVGGKGANLGEMVKAGFPVPNGFIVTAYAYFAFLQENNLVAKIKHVLETAKFDDPTSLEQVSKHIKKFILHGDVSPQLIKEVFATYKHLSGVFTDALVAVRSSATAEDLPDASFAGQQETFLNVQGEANVLIKIKEAWASLFEPRAIFYRHEKHFDHFKVGIAIPVQKMVESEKSGVMFTLDPVTNDKKKIIVEAIYGLGELIVQGTVTPDHYEVEKSSLKIIDKKISHQSELLRKAGIKNKKIRLSKDQGSKQKITDEQITQLAKLGVKLEKHYYFPQDIEWAIEKNTIYIVQTRPVTTIHNAQKPVDIGHLSLTILLHGDPASPGIASGPVKILASAKEISKVVSGDVLVAPQTNPDFVPAMKKAVAIITDMGGRTCFGESTRVLANVGFLSIKELYNRLRNNEQFFVFSFDYNAKKPTWKRVLSVQKNQLKSVRINVSQSGNMKNNTIDVTPDHKFFTYSGRTLIKKPIQNILASSEAVCLVDYLPKASSKLLISDKLAYLLGTIATDGNIYLKKGIKGWRSGLITFTQKQCEYKQDFIQTVSSYFTEIYKDTFHERFKYSLSFMQGRLISGYATDYRCYNLSVALKLKKILNDLAILAISFSEKNALNFLAGAIDGDGSFSNNRIQIYVSKKNVLEGIILSCLRLGIFPQITSNRNIYNVQILERMSDILKYSQKIKIKPIDKVLGNKLFAAKQIFSDISDSVNYKGRIKTYIYDNLYIDYRKIKKYILPMVNQQLKTELDVLLNSSLRMQRVNFVENLGKIDVYNIEVESNSELDHNYIVFTARYTPLLVSNSHAAIVSREIGIPAVVGTQHATKVLKDGMIVTVNGAKGEIYKGSPGHIGQQTPQEEVHIKTATKVYVNLAEPEFAERIAKRHVDGVGLLRAEFMMAGIGVHPKKMIHDGKKNEYIKKLAEGLGEFCRVFTPRPVVYRASDFKTNEYRHLVGGKEFESEEPNPMLGFRGAYRYIHDPHVFQLELEAIKLVRNKMNLKNLWLMLPFVRTVHELVEVKKIIAASGLYRSSTFKLWMMVEIPSNVILLDKFIEVGIDGVSIGSNDLTMLMLGTDRDNNEVAQAFDEQNNALLWAYEHVIKTAHTYHVTSSMCGQAPSQYPELLEKLVKWGITSVSVSPDAIDITRKYIAEFERKLIS